MENVARLSLAAVQKHFEEGSPDFVAYEQGLVNALATDVDTPGMPLFKELIAAPNDEARTELLTIHIKSVSPKDMKKAISEFTKARECLGKGIQDVQEVAGLCRAFYQKHFGPATKKVANFEKGAIDIFTNSEHPGMKLLKELLDADNDESRVSILTPQVIPEPESDKEIISPDQLIVAIHEIAKVMRSLRIGLVSKALQDLQQVGGVCFGVLYGHYGEGSPEMTAFEKGLEAAFENPYPEELPKKEDPPPAVLPQTVEEKPEPAPNNLHVGKSLLQDLLGADSDESRVSILNVQMIPNTESNLAAVSPDQLLEAITEHASKLFGLGQGLQSPEMQNLQMVCGICFGVLHEHFAADSPEMIRFEEGLTLAFEDPSTAQKAAPEAAPTSSDDQPGMVLLQELLTSESDQSRAKILVSQLAPKPESNMAAVTSDQLLQAIAEYSIMVQSSSSSQEFQAQEMQNLQQVAGVCYGVLHELFGEGSEEMSRFEQGLHSAFEPVS